MPITNIRIISISAGRACSAADSIAALVVATGEWCNWDIILVQEVDAMHANLQDDARRLALHPHVCLRHYAGLGNTAGAVIIHSKLLNYVQKVDWYHRSVSILWSGSS